MRRYRESIPQTIRKRVEVAIFRHGHVLIICGRSDDGTHWFGFPGGGQDGASLTDAVIKESLEEVGVGITNIEITPLTQRAGPAVMAIDDQGLRYAGSVTTYLVADYGRVDTRILGHAGDASEYVWMLQEEALQCLADTELVDNSIRRKLLQEYWR